MKLVPFILRSSFILKIMRERARKTRIHRRDNADQKIISKKVQTPKIRTLEEESDKARS